MESHFAGMKTKNEGSDVRTCSDLGFGAMICRQGNRERHLRLEETGYERYRYVSMYAHRRSV